MQGFNRFIYITCLLTVGNVVVKCVIVELFIKFFENETRN